MMDSLEFEGSIEVEGKSLLFIIREVHSGREQVYPVVKVKSTASPCLMYGRWELALGDFELGDEFEIVNPEKVAIQIESLLEQIEDHRRSPCGCTETVDTKYFRGLRAKMKGGQYVISLGYFDNRSDSVQFTEVGVYRSERAMLEAMKLLLLWGMKHKTFVGADPLDLTAIEHDSTEVVIAIGEMFEDWHYGRLDRQLDKASRELISEIESLIPKAIEFQEENLP